MHPSAHTVSTPTVLTALAADYAGFITDANDAQTWILAAFEREEFAFAYYRAVLANVEAHGSRAYVSQPWTRGTLTYVGVTTY